MSVLTRFRAVFILVFFASTPAAAESLPPETRWADPSSVELDIEFPGEGYHAAWDLYRCDCGDLLVRAELSVPGVVETGDILLVEGKAVLSRGFGEYKDEAADSLDAAALMMQLALRLLERAEPAGPSKIEGTADVDLTDEINHINLDTGAAEGGFRAPWRVRGNISEAGDTRRKFDLGFDFTVNVAGEIQQGSMRLKGLAEFADTNFPAPGSSPLSEWELRWRHPEDERPVTAKTLEELRAQLRAD